jgi:DNA-binding HxlR family transcriptional regulator
MYFLLAPKCLLAISIAVVTHRVLTVQLKELEEHGMVERNIYPQLPPKVEYSLTEIG